MVKDILGRELKFSDIVIVKCDYYSDLEIGVFDGKNVRIKSGISRNKSSVYIVERPGPQELNIKKEILDQLAKEMAEKAKKNAQKADVPGTVYVIKNFCNLYCGKCLITTYKDGELSSQLTGHLYLLGAPSFTTFEQFRDYNQECMRTGAVVQLNKSVKKYQEVGSAVEVPDSFVLESVCTDTDDCGPVRKYKMRQEVQIVG